ncbi:MAG: efflux RND transporter permease subunit [Gammaproteobacteria bacterium]|nr:efflux RND transporter permease subunit [Gammaproteobacteria bacterium]MYD80318.1 efflux RND transporter permease subunit [Gammaproteobacteria bacterium]
MNFFESLAGLATRRPIAICVLAVSVGLVGVLAFNRLPINLLPDLQSPTVTVSVRSGDRPPQEMERLYGESLESQLYSVRGVVDVEQVARTGRLIATVHFDWDTNIDTGLIDVQKAVGGFESNPQVDEVLVKRFDPSQEPILILGLVAPSGDPDLVELRQIARRQLATSLEALTGVAEVQVTGGRQREISVIFDEYRASAFGISLGEIAGRISSENRDINAGVLEDRGNVFTVRGRMRFEDASDVEDVIVRYMNIEGSSRVAVRVKDVADVVPGVVEIDHIVMVNGQEGVGLSIYKEAGANTVSVSQTITEAMTGLSEDLPDVEVHMITDNATLVVDALDDLRFAALVGIALAIVVLAFFLRSIGATFIVSLAVPVSILTAIFFMHFGNYSFNIVTLGGLALGAGMLVDNAIVVVESMYRRIRAGDSPVDAARKGTGLVAGAITASTLTTCVVFIPVFFVQGLAARLIDGIAFTVVISLVASLAVAVFFIPALGQWFLEPAKRDELGNVVAEKVHPIRRGLESMVSGFLRVPWLIVLISAVAVGGAVYGLLGLGTELLPPSDPKQFSVRIIGPSGQRVESTAKLVEGIESSIRAGAPEFVNATLAEIGRLPDDDRVIREEMTEENTARLIVRLTDEAPPGKAFAAAMSDDLDEIPNTEIEWELNRSALSEALDTGMAPVVVEISGNTLSDLRDITEEIRVAMVALPELWNVRSSFEGGPPELRVRLDHAVADALGIDMNTVASVLQSNLDGQNVTYLSVGDEEYPVMLRMETVHKEELDDVVFLASGGRKVAIGEIAKFEEVTGAREIFRRDQRRVAQVTALVNEGFTQPQAINSVNEVLKDKPLPTGMTIALRGEEEERAKTFGELQLAGILALLLVLLVLAGSFESLLQPITILYAIPVGLIGVAGALVPFGEPIGVMVMLGLIVLAGVAVNDAVLLVATARQLMADGKERIQALSEAAGIRLRPITMTTLTTTLALTPLLFGGGEGAVLRQPMAMTIIGGLAASTIGSLLVLPCLYLILDDIGRFFGRFRR